MSATRRPARCDRKRRPCCRRSVRLSGSDHLRASEVCPSSARPRLPILAPLEQDCAAETKRSRQLRQLRPRSSRLPPNPECWACRGAARCRMIFFHSNRVAFAHRNPLIRADTGAQQRVRIPSRTSITRRVIPLRMTVRSSMPDYSRVRMSKISLSVGCRWGISSAQPLRHAGTRCRNSRWRQLDGRRRGAHPQRDQTPGCRSSRCSRQHAVQRTA